MERSKAAINARYANFKHEGILNLSYPKNLRLAVEKAVNSWQRFCEIPENSKAAFLYTNASDGIGYERKEGIGKNADKKENFDITTSGRKWLESNQHLLEDDAQKFVRDAVKLVHLTEPIILEFAKQVETQFGLHDFFREVVGSKDVFFFRFIHYFGNRKPGEEIAAAHADQSGFTLHLYESAPGLERLSYDGKWVDMPVSDGETAIIPAMQIQLRSRGELKATCHRVVATKETANTGRFSAVCFIQLKNSPKYDKTTAGRLQEKEPGFNYDMPIEEFSKLFK